MMQLILVVNSLKKNEKMIIKFNKYKKLTDTYWEKNNKRITLLDILELTKNIKTTKIKTKLLLKHVLSWNNKKENDKIDKSNLKYPPLILINDNNTIKYILDGNHRVQKAIKYNIKEINVKLILFNKLPENIKKILE